MRRFILRRILTGILTIIIVFALNFTVMKMAPGDPITTLMGKENNSPEMRKALEEKYGMDKPLVIQFFSYLKTAATGDLGTSITYNRSVTSMIREKIGATVLLGLTAAILAAVIGTAMGIIAARREGRCFDIISSGASYTFNSMPAFWLGLMLIILFSSRLGWFPSYGMTDTRADYTGGAYVLDVLKHMFLPVLTLTLVLLPQYFRIAKSSVIQTANEDFITTFRAAGMSEKKIFRKYIFRNAMLPTITIFGISMAYLITGVTLIEIVFAWPGMGRLVMTAITQRDYPTLMGIYLIMSVSVAVVMLAVDIVYAMLDPRIRYE